jgi:hypothetical protein
MTGDQLKQLTASIDRLAAQMRLANLIEIERLKAESNFVDFNKKRLSQIIDVLGAIDGTL